jgi:hypothetical protein
LSYRCAHANVNYSTSKRASVAKSTGDFLKFLIANSLRYEKPFAVDMLLSSLRYFDLSKPAVLQRPMLTRVPADPVTTQNAVDQPMDTSFEYVSGDANDDDARTAAVQQTQRSDTCTQTDTNMDTVTPTTASCLTALTDSERQVLACVLEREVAAVKHMLSGLCRSSLLSQQCFHAGAHEQVEMLRAQRDAVFSQAPARRCRYTLRAVIVHQGAAADSGHYYAYVNRVDHAQPLDAPTSTTLGITSSGVHTDVRWNKYNDSVVSSATWEDVTRDSFGNGTGCYALARMH